MADHVRMNDAPKLLPGGLLSTGQAARILQCSIPTVHRTPREDLPYIKIGNRRRYRLLDVQVYKKIRDGR